MVNCITCGQPHDETETHKHSSRRFGARPGLIIAGVGLGLVVIPFGVLALLHPTGPVPAELGWGTAGIAIFGQLLIFVGLILALIGGLAKGIRDSKR